MQQVIIQYKVIIQIYINLQSIQAKNRQQSPQKPNNTKSQNIIMQANTLRSHHLNCYTLTHPVYASISASTPTPISQQQKDTAIKLIIADQSNFVYLFELGEEPEAHCHQQRGRIQANIIEGGKDAKLIYDMQQHNYLEISSEANSRAPLTAQPERANLEIQPSYVYRSRRKNFPGDQSLNSQNQNQQNNSYSPYLKMHVGMPVSKCQLHLLQVPVYQQKQKLQQSGIILSVEMIIALGKGGQLIIWYKAGDQNRCRKQDTKNETQYGNQGTYLKFSFDQSDIQNKQITYADFYLYRNQSKGPNSNQYILYVAAVQQQNKKTNQKQQKQNSPQTNQNRYIKLYKYSIIMRKSQISTSNQPYTISFNQCSPAGKLRIPQKNAKVYKKSSIPSPLIPMPPLSPIFPWGNKPTSFPAVVPSIKILNKARNLLIDTTIHTLPFEQQHVRELDSLQCIVHIQFGQRYILYADQLSVFAYDCVTSKNVNVLCEEGVRGSNQEGGRQVVNLCFGQTDSWFIVALLDVAKDYGVLVKIYGVNGMSLWDIDCSYIHKPILINQSYQSLLFLNFLAPSTLKTHHLSKSTILSAKPSIIGCNRLNTEQKKLHQSTINTLKHRLQILKTLQNYHSNGDLGSVFRLLQNCGNNGLLNDGIRFVGNLMQCEGEGERTYGNNQLHLMNLANLLLQQSKYQSHIQTGLQVLLSITKSLKSSLTQNSTSISSLPPKLWQQYAKQLRQIAGSKKLRKLQQQQKNKRVFQLAYEFVHTTNSFVLR